jgi:23S rRNA (guanosine2251-2'-O)-methyltransferase
MKGHSLPRVDQTIWVSGINPAREAFRASSLAILEIVVARDDHRVNELLASGKQKNIPIRHEARNSLSELVGHTHHQGIALRVQEYPYADFDRILGLPIHEREPLIILDSVQDPQNLGAIMRSGCFLGAKAVIIPKDRSARVTAAVIKVAAGAASYIPVVQVVNLARALEQLKEAGHWIMGLDVEGRRSLYEADLSVPLGLVIGNEQKGLRPLIRKSCDLLVQVPAHGPIQSLNAATAGAVALAEVQRQRSNC